MGRPRVLTVMAALALASAALYWPGAAQAATGRGQGAVRVACFLQPRTLDVRVNPGALIARLEMFSGDGGVPLDPGKLEPGVRVDSVAGTRLPAPSATVEGISELRSARRVEDVADVAGHSQRPNGVPEAVLRFERPSDGDPKTAEDGNAGDILAMLTDVPDGASAEVCLGGRVDGTDFVCCDSLTVRNRGLRDLPPELRPKGDGSHP